MSHVPEFDCGAICQLLAAVSTVADMRQAVAGARALASEAAKVLATVDAGLQAGSCQS